MYTPERAKYLQGADPDLQKLCKNQCKGITLGKVGRAASRVCLLLRPIFTQPRLAHLAIASKLCYVIR
jgi:hypothetical protein